MTGWFLVTRKGSLEWLSLACAWCCAQTLAAWCCSRLASQQNCLLRENRYSLWVSGLLHDLDGAVPKLGKKGSLSCLIEFGLNTPADLVPARWAWWYCRMATPLHPTVSSRRTLEPVPHGKEAPISGSYCLAKPSKTPASVFFLVCAYYLAFARTHLQGQVRSFLPFVFNQASLSYHLEWNSPV